MDFGVGDLNIVLNVTLRTVRRNLKFYLYETATLSRKVWKHRVHVFCTMQQFAMQTQFPLQDVLHFSFVYRDRSNAKRKLTILRGLFFAKVRIKERKIVFPCSWFCILFSRRQWKSLMGKNLLGASGYFSCLPLAPGVNLTLYFNRWYTLLLLLSCVGILCSL